MTKSEILSFLDAQTILTVTTMNGEQPETRALINIRNKNIAPHLTHYFKKNDRIFFITNTQTDKIVQIRKNPKANVYAYDNNFSGLLLIGEIKEITDKDIIDILWDDSWKMYYPGGKDGGDFSLLEFIPKQFKNYNGNGFVKTSGAV
ncbi:MAG: pyridoxamine 5'-phosphate oxidase family protein [Puniceicoccales bacterium]|jgi:general stress protein 26|nr:pyridoxamine 5'-phosphate oxidase family protein [Puniceicoccales bacterium]